MTQYTLHFTQKSVADKAHKKVRLLESTMLFFVFCLLSFASPFCCGTRADNTGTNLHRFAACRNAECFAFSPNGRTLVAGGERVQVFDAATGHCRLNEVSRHGEVLSLAFSPDSALLALGIEDDNASTGRIELRDGYTGRLRRVFKTFGPQDTPASYLAFSPSGDILAGEGGSEDSSEGYLRLWQVRTGRLKMDVWVDKFTPPLFLPSGKLLVTLNVRDGVRLLSVRTGQVVGVLPCRLDLQRVALSRDGVFLALAGYVPPARRFAAPEHQIEIWNVHTRTRWRVLTQTPSQSDDVQFCPDGRLLTVEGKAQIINGRVQAAPSVFHFWNIQSNSFSPSFTIGDAASLGTAFSPSSHDLAVLTRSAIWMLPVSPHAPQTKAASCPCRKWASGCWSSSASRGTTTPSSSAALATARSSPPTTPETPSAGECLF